MTRHLIEDPAIRRQLNGLLEDLDNRLIALGSGDTYTGWDAPDIAGALTGSSKLYIGPSAAAEMVVKGLLDRSHLEDPEFWGSALGRAVAFWGTGVPASVSRACAAAALGCGRANLSLMVRKGQLSEDETSTTFPRQITTASLAHAMRTKFPLGA